MFNAVVSLLVASLTTTALSLDVFFLRLHDVSLSGSWPINFRDADSASPSHPSVDGIASVLFRTCACGNIQFPFGEQVIQVGTQQIGLSRSFAGLRPPIFRS